MPQTTRRPPPAQALRATAQKHRYEKRNVVIQRSCVPSHTARGAQIGFHCAASLMRGIDMIMSTTWSSEACCHALLAVAVPEASYDVLRPPAPKRETARFPEFFCTFRFVRNSLLVLGVQKRRGAGGCASRH